MSRMVSFTRIRTLTLFRAFMILAITTTCFGADKPIAPAAKIDQTVLAALSRQGAMKPKVISHIDLTQPFGTISQWTFVVAQEEAPPDADSEDQGPLRVCFVKGSTPDCSENPYHRDDSKDASFDAPYRLRAGSLVYSSQNQSGPLLFIQLCGAQAVNGNCGVATELYRYEKGADHFVQVFKNLTGRNNNEDTRFLTQGPLQGDVIVNYPTANAPYTYWIEVYRANDSGKYVQVLRYRGSTHYGDGNQLAVTDSEMPSILTRLGLWKPGDALPVPPHMPKGCSRLFMQKDEEWCK